MNYPGLTCRACIARLQQREDLLLLVSVRIRELESVLRDVRTVPGHKLDEVAAEVGRMTALEGVRG